MPAVTISAGYGAAGYRIARAVADTLELPLIDRAISSEVARMLGLSVEEADDATIRRTFTERFFAALAPMAGGVIGTDADQMLDPALAPTHDSELFRREAEAIMRRALPYGLVVLGRAGAAALRTESKVLRVRLFGARKARIAQACAFEGFSEQTAAERLVEVDRARAMYVRRLYGYDIDDPALYHLQLDSTVIPVEGCAQAIVASFRALVDQP